MIVIDKTYKFGVTWEVMESVDGFFYGTINFIINGEIIPVSCPFNYTIGTVFWNLRNSFKEKEYPEGSKDELGSKKINYNKLDLGEELNIFQIETTEMGGKFGDNCQYGCINLWLGYDGSEERLIYSTDFNSSFKEIRLPRNTVETVIMRLPIKKEILLRQYKKNMKN